MKAIRPGRFRSEFFKQYVLEEAKQTAKDIEKDFRETTKTWEHKPDFERMVSISPSPVEVMVSTDDEIYGYVSEGTKPHPIFAKNAPLLVFPWGGPGSYRPKTKPRVIGSTAGGSSGPLVAFPYVQHPGTEARQFDETIRKKWDPIFKRRMEGVLSDFARASGHYAG